MSDNIPAPTVVTTIRIGGFTIYAYAYRNLTRSECVIVRDMYLQQSHRKTIPAKGSAKVFTLFGSSPESGL